MAYTEKENRDYLLKAWQQKRLVHAYLFTGKQDAGGLESAMWFAQLVFCPNSQAEIGPCQTCSTCQRIAQGEFLGVERICPDGKTIKVEQIREMKTEMSQSGLETNTKVFIIEQAEKMSISAANSLLKFLEEPEQPIYFILMSENPLQILATIQSRCQLIAFADLNKAAYAQQLRELGISDAMSQLLVYLAKNKEQAILYAQEESFQQLQLALWQYFVLLLKQDNQALVYIETDLMKYLNSKEYAELGLDILSVYVYDLILACHGLIEQVVMKQYETVYQQYRFDNWELAHFDKVIQAKQHLHANVSVQACYELLTIELLAIGRKE